MATKNYLNNYDLLVEINRSKMSYCWVENIKTQESYDTILSDKMELIVFSDIANAYHGRAKRLSREAHDAEVVKWTKNGKEGLKPRPIDCTIDPSTIKLTDLVIREMTYEHIPKSDRKKTKKITADHYERINFPPFKQYAFDHDDPELSQTIIEFLQKREAIKASVYDQFTDDDEVKKYEKNKPTVIVKKGSRSRNLEQRFNELDAEYNDKFLVHVAGLSYREVTRSHWKGDLETGEFCQTHGRYTEKLGRMIVLLCRRYITKGNWAAYSYADEMCAEAILHLSTVGLQFDESRTMNPFAYYTQCMKNIFTGVLNAEKRNQEIRDDLLVMSDNSPSSTRQFNDEWEIDSNRADSNDY